MAIQKGIIQLEGIIGEICFYKTKYGYVARQKSRLDGKRVKEDPDFARTMENAREFGLMAEANKLIRKAFSGLLKVAGSKATMHKLTKVLTAIKQLDNLAARGERKVGTALNPEARALLKGFDFNPHSALDDLLLKPLTTDTTTGKMEITGLVPGHDLAVPTGVTHVRFRGCISLLDFDARKYIRSYTNEETIPVNDQACNITLVPVYIPSGPGVQVFAAGINFLQEVNGTLYPFRDMGFEALRITAVV